ncbi:prolyl oligopeptidase family serine peptidase [Geodermatophilus sp. SYSU D00700]
MRPADLALVRTPGTPTVSPDGRMAVVAVDRADADGVRGQLWAVPTDGSAPARPLTSSAHDSAPAFSPDGRWLAYLSAPLGGPPQVHLLPTAGGAPRRLTDAPAGAGAPVWSPDSRRLAWIAPVPEAHDGPRLVTSLSTRAGAPRTCVVVLDLPADPLGDDAGALAAPRQLTDGAGHDADVTWSPDGTALAFVAARHPGADRDAVRDVYLVPATGGRPRRVTRSRGACRQPVFDAAGTTVLVVARPDLGPDGLDVTASAPVLCRVPVSGGELEPVPGRVVPDGAPGPVRDGGAALVGAEREGAVELVRVPLDGGPPATLVDGPFAVRGCSAAAGVVVATVAHDRSAGELVAITPSRRRLLTGFGSALGATGRLHRTAQRAVVTPDGTEQRVWVTVPPGPGPHPVLLEPGPARPEWSLADEVQVHVSAGYAVVRCDADAGDVLALLDAVLADPALDAGRVGLAGGPGSVPLLTRTDRFAAAVVDWTGGLDPWGADDPADVAAVVTPTLGVQDERCPAGAGRRLFAALQRRRVPSALLLVPGDDPAAGRPRHRAARLEHLLDWWDRWLPVAATGPADEVAEASG